jgi:hypothetical protein
MADPNKPILKDPTTGRFLAGTGGAARKKGNNIEARLEQSRRQVKAKHLDRVYWALLGQCLKGDIPAIRLYYDRFVGKIPDSMDITNHTTEEVQNPEEIRQMYLARRSELDAKLGKESS